MPFSHQRKLRPGALAKALPQVCRGHIWNEASATFQGLMWMRRLYSRGPHTVAHTPSQACHLFSYGPPTTNSFCIFRWLGGWGDYFVALEKYMKFTFVPINTILWELGHIHSFMDCLCLCFKLRRQTPHGPQSLKYLLFSPFHKVCRPCFIET